MTFVLYKVRSEKEIHFSNPLHWSNFFQNKQRHHHQLMLKRQDLILYLANLHAKAVSTGMPLGLIEIPSLMSSSLATTSTVGNTRSALSPQKDYRNILL